jgi:DNA repair exonuclease SbcCD ATPase subunit
MKILSLQAENFKNLKAVELKLDGKGAIITGKNGAGKSSVLDAVCVAFGGKKAMPKQPIRNGESKSLIVLETEDIVIERHITGKGDRVVIKNKDGLTYGSPQSLLDRLVGQISFDPLAFAKMDAKDQRAALLDLLGVDLEPFDDKHAGLKAERSVVLSDIKRMDVDFQRMEFDETLPREEIKVGELTTNLTEALAHNATLDGLKKKEDETANDVANLQDNLESLAVRIRDLEKQIAEAEKQLAKEKEDMAVLEQSQEGVCDLYADAAEKVKQFKPTDVVAIQDEINKVEETNKGVRANAEYRKTSMAIERKRKESSDLLKAMKAVEDEKTQALAKAPMPVKGLSVDDDGVVYEGMSLKDGINHAKQLEVCVAIGMKMNPKLNVMLLDINGVGTEALQAIEKMAADHEPPYQLLMEKMDETGDVGIYIEDGSVVDENASEQGDTEEEVQDGPAEDGTETE